MATEPIPDKRQMRRAFDRAAPDYDAAAVLQREVGQRLLERLDLIRFTPQRILDAGCGTGLCLPGLRQRYPKASITALDIAEGMLRTARGRQGLWQRLRKSTGFVCGDVERLPLRDESVDLIFSNLTFQWCVDLPAMFAELRRVLRPGGLLLFTSFGPDTLHELRDSWAQVDDRPHVNVFPDMHHVGDWLLQTPFADPVTDVERITLTYDDVFAIMRDLKTIGAHNVLAGRARGLTGKSRIAALREAYETWRRDGRLPVTYEVVFGHAWKAAQTSGTQQTVCFTPTPGGRGS